MVAAIISWHFHSKSTSRKCRLGRSKYFVAPALAAPVVVAPAPVPFAHAPRYVTQLARVAPLAHEQTLLFQLFRYFKLGG